MLRVATLALFCLVLVVVPATGQVLYENGPVDGITDAWAINFGYAVTNSIQVHGTIQGLEFWVWLFPGDPPPSSVQVTISQPSSVRPGHSRVLFDGIVSLTQGGCFTNIFDQQVCQESARFDGPTLNGIAWLTLQNAIIPSGNPVYWDQNSGVSCQSPGCPSRAYENTVGTIPSETFTIFGR